MCVQLFFDWIATDLRKRNENRRLSNILLTSNVIINMYITSLNILCTLNKDIKTTNMNEVRDFNLMDMADMYSPIIMSNDSVVKTKIMNYARCEKMLVDHFNFLLTMVKFEFHDDLLNIMLTFIGTNFVYGVDSIMSLEMQEVNNEMMQKISANIDDLSYDFSSNYNKDDKTIILIEFYKQLKRKSVLIREFKKKINEIS